MKIFAIAAALVPAVLAAQTPPTPLPTPPGVNPPSAVARSVIPVDRVVAIVGDQPVLWTQVLTAINQRRAQGMQLPPEISPPIPLSEESLREILEEEASRRGDG